MRYIGNKGGFYMILGLKLFQALIILLIPIFVTEALFAKTKNNSQHHLNCLGKDIKNEKKELCSRVIDPLKAKKQILSIVNCTKELEDGYTLNICEHVDIVEQVLLREDVLSCPDAK